MLAFLGGVIVSLAFGILFFKLVEGYWPWE